MLKTGRLDRKYNGIMECFSRTAKASSSDTETSF